MSSWRFLFGPLHAQARLCGFQATEEHEGERLLTKKEA